MTENEKYDILLTGQIAALDAMKEDFDDYDFVGYEYIDDDISLVMQNPIMEAKKRYTRIIVLASLALKKIKENDRA